MSLISAISPISPVPPDWKLDYLGFGLAWAFLSRVAWIYSGILFDPSANELLLAFESSYSKICESADCRLLPAFVWPSSYFWYSSSAWLYDILLGCVFSSSFLGVSWDCLLAILWWVVWTSVSICIIELVLLNLLYRVLSLSTDRSSKSYYKPIDSVPSIRSSSLILTRPSALLSRSAVFGIGVSEQSASLPSFGLVALKPDPWSAADDMLLNLLLALP